MQHGKTGAGTSSWLLIPLAAALIVIGAKFWMIARYGFPMPIWDQLDDEGGFISQISGRYADLVRSSHTAQ